MQKTCSWDECDRPAAVRGFCRTHYYKMREQGMQARPKVDPFVRVMDSVSKDEFGCWRASVGIGGTGYSRVYYDRMQRPSHRLVYERMVGPIPEGFEVDHLCKVKNCVNPDHLEAVTPEENLARSDSQSSKNARKTHCPKGHEYNMVRSDGGGRACRECFLARKRAYRLRKIAAAIPCTIEDCEKPQMVRTFCEKHAARFYKYGDPTRTS